MCEVDVFEHHRFCDEFSHLVRILFVETLTLSWSFSLMEKMFERIETFLRIVTYIMQLSIIYLYGLTSVWSRCFWASQILWWILTSSEDTFCGNVNTLLKFFFDGSEVWKNLNVPQNCHIYYAVFNYIFLRFNKCVK